MTRQKRVTPRKTTRIYYGPPGAETSLYWTVAITPAKRNVIINGEVLHALQGSKGVTIGCSLSNAVIDNAKAFPHPAYLASFTKHTAKIIDRLKKDGTPAHAVVYYHRYGHIIDANDTGTIKKMVKENPALMQRQFTLEVPPPPRPAGQPRGSQVNVGKTDKGKAVVFRGALQRAVRAGRMSAHVARQIVDVAKKSSTA